MRRRRRSSRSDSNSRSTRRDKQGLFVAVKIRYGSKFSSSGSSSSSSSNSSSNIWVVGRRCDSDSERWQRSLAGSGSIATRRSSEAFSCCFRCQCKRGLTNWHSVVGGPSRRGSCWRGRRSRCRGAYLVVLMFAIKWRVNWVKKKASQQKSKLQF